jgi:DNA-binding response OmpR family regulator
LYHAQIKQAVAMAKILLVEDDIDLTSTMSDFLEHEGYTVEHAGDGAEANFRLSSFKYDLIMLDWNLPKMSGLDVLKNYRSSGGRTPVLMLTGRGGLSDKESGLDMGADDYLSKPFHLTELSARLRALLRRSYDFPDGDVTIQVRNLELSSASRKLTVDGMNVHLSPKDFALLEFMMQHPDDVFSYEALAQRAWGDDGESSEEAVRSAIKRVRKKIGDVEGTVIENLSKAGYRLNSKR